MTEDKRSPLHDWHVEHEADVVWEDGYPWAMHEGADPRDEYEAVRTATGIWDLYSTCKYEVRGPDAARLIQRRFTNALEFDLTGRKLTMTDCWVNVMTRQVVHGLHLHPLATISGTYYVRTPRGCSGLKFEDPRLDRFMAAPPRKVRARRDNKAWVTIPAEQGRLVLFESWLRHEVAPNPTEAERISISFNYSWF